MPEPRSGGNGDCPFIFRRGPFRVRFASRSKINGPSPSSAALQPRWLCRRGATPARVPGKKPRQEGRKGRPPTSKENRPMTTTHDIEPAHRRSATARAIDNLELYSLDVSDQLRLLKSLGHWVGDVHQPLHVSFDDDRGGNLVAMRDHAGPIFTPSGTPASSRKRSGLIMRRSPPSFAPRSPMTTENAGYLRPSTRRPLSPGLTSPPPSPKSLMSNIASRRTTHAGIPPISNNTEAALRGLLRSMMATLPRRLPWCASASRWLA